MALFDAVFAAFKGGGTPVPLSPALYSHWSPTFDGSDPLSGYDYATAIRDGYLANPIAQRAVRIVAEGVGQAPIAVENAKLRTLVNTTSVGQPLLETLAAHLLLHGNAYVQIIKDGKGRPAELFALRPDRMKAVTGEDGWPCAYEYQLAAKTITIPLEDDQGWPEILHIKSMHPLDDHYGAGALAAAHKAIAIHNAASGWNNTLLNNAARPSGALVYDGGDGVGLTTDQFERLKSELTSAFSGAGNAGRPMLLDGGLRWQSMALSPADMDFATLKSTAAREIALAFGVPPMLLGLPGDNTYSNYREANRALWRMTLLPLAQKLLASLLDGLRPWFPSSDLGVEMDRVPALSEDRERLWKQLSEADFLTRAEKRKMLGLATEEKPQ